MNTQRWMSRNYFSFFMTWGIFLPYWTGWLIHAKGLSVSQASLIMSLGLVARGLSALAVFPFFSVKLSSKTLLNSSAIGTLLAIICYIPANSFASLLLITLLLHFCYPMLMPALDSAAGILLQSGQLKHYGKSRLWGSIGFVVSGIVLTVFTGKFGDQLILWAFFLGTLVIVGFGFLRAPDELSVRTKEDHSKRGSMLNLFRIKHFGLVLIIVIMLQAAHASYYTYGYLFLQHIHAPEYMIGLIINIAVLAEILFFSIADHMFKKWSVGSLLTFAALGSTVRWLLVFTFPNVADFCISQPLHACSFAMCHYAFMKFLTRSIPHTQIPKAQGMYSALALSWGTSVFTIFGGFLYEIEPRYAFIGMIVCTLPSLLFALVFRNMELRKVTSVTLGGIR